MKRYVKLKRMDEIKSIFLKVDFLGINWLGWIMQWSLIYIWILFILVN